MSYLAKNWIAKNQLHEFIQALANLLKAGLNLTQALEILQANNQQAIGQKLIPALQDSINQGLSLSSACAKFPAYFSVQNIALIQCGEISGNLAKTLKQLAEQQSLRLQFKKKLKRALAYPSFILLASLGVSLGITEWLIPLFVHTFNQSKQSLPYLTQIILIFSEKFPTYALLTALGLMCTVYGIHLAMTLYFPLRWTLAKFSSHCLIIGKLLQLFQLNHWLCLMSHYLQAGLHLAEALKSSSSAFNHLYYQVHYQQCLQSLAAGFSLSQSLQESKIFPAYLVRWIFVGECSGNLNQAFKESAAFYEEELHNYLHYLTQFIEPLSLLLISLLIAMLVIALYLPLFRMGEMI